MGVKKTYAYPVAFVLCLFLIFPAMLLSQEPSATKILAEKVRTFLENRRGTWRDLNIPASDGKTLYDLIIKNNYKKALRDGPLGYSGIKVQRELNIGGIQTIP
jgi:caffeoyl-CoA O-methyltransferase